jgi:hypothetical protein
MEGRMGLTAGLMVNKNEELSPMITGIHSLLYTKDAEGLRTFLRDVLEFPSIDVGHGWLIYGLPPSELGVHPTEGKGYTEMHLMCDDIEATVAKLKSKGVEFLGPVSQQPWGLAVQFRIPGGGEMGLYQPRHPTALHLSGRAGD